MKINLTKLLEVEVRVKKEKDQRERLNTRFAGRKAPQDSADADLIPPNDETNFNGPLEEESTGGKQPYSFELEEL